MLIQVDIYTEFQVFIVKTSHNEYITFINTYIQLEHSPDIPANLYY